MMLEDHVRPDTPVDPSTKLPEFPPVEHVYGKWDDIDEFWSCIVQPRPPVEDGVRHSREHTRKQRIRHKHRRSALSGRRCKRSCNCSWCKRGLMRRNRIDAETDQAVLGEVEDD